MFRFQRIALALLTATVVTPVVASDLLIPFPAGTVVSRTAGPPALCRVVVQGYTFDSTLLGAGNAASTCTASNVLSPNPPFPIWRMQFTKAGRGSSSASYRKSTLIRARC